MPSRRVIACLCLATGVLLWVAAAAHAQVDWSDIFPDEGKRPAVQAPRPQPHEAAPEKPVAAAPERVAPPPARHVKVQPKRRVTREVAKAQPRRRVVQPAAADDESEFPVTDEVPAAQFDRTSQRHKAAPVKVTAEAHNPAVEAAHAAPPVKHERAVAEASADTIAQPAVHENAHKAAAVREPEVAEVAPAADRHAAKARVAPPEEAAPVAAEAPPVQVAAAPAEAAVFAGHSRREPAPAPADGLPDLESLGLHPGDAITADNMDKYTQLLSPGMEWAVRYGWRIRVAEPRHVEMPRAYREATEKYLGQPKLAPDGLRVANWTAGQPFPKIDPNDPQIALKIMWNYSYGFAATDDLDAQNFDADTGTIGKNRGMTVERHYMIDDLRRLYFTGRLVVDPKPELPNPDGIRYKESLHPLSEPFDLKGVGATFYRYIDPDRQDDSWLYLPQLRRVRRLSTAQRSDALFGQDSDVDSYYGFSGHIAWMDWKFLGERTVLGVMHAQHAPVKWQDPEDWAFDDIWEPRRVYVIEGTSKLPQYAYGKRILFIDKEGYVVTHSDIYDRAGQLWKVWVNLYSYKKEAIPGAKVSKYPDEMAFINGIVMLDTQLVHATRAALPSTHSKGQECIFLNMGAKSGTTEDFFTVANLIEAGH